MKSTNEEIEMIVFLEQLIKEQILNTDILPYIEIDEQRNKVTIDMKIYTEYCLSTIKNVAMGKGIFLKMNKPL